MKVTKIKSGYYSVSLHGHTFTLEKPFGNTVWRLYNSMGTELSKVETKGGMLEMMGEWSDAHTAEYSAEMGCSYA